MSVLGSIPLSVSTTSFDMIGFPNYDVVLMTVSPHPVNFWGYVLKDLKLDESLLQQF